MNLEKAREILANEDTYGYDNHLSHVERLVIFEAVAKRLGKRIELYAEHDILYIGEFDELTEAMFEEEFMLLVKSGCYYDKDSDNWVIYT